MAFKSLAEFFEDPAKATPFGFLENPSMKYMGMQRSEQLHIAFRAVQRFRDQHKHFPSDNAENIDEVIAYAHKINEEGKANEKLTVE